jgi:hypothetical protein
MKTILILLIGILTNLQAYSQNQSKCPCCTAEARQFDFWVGQWETYISGNKLAGTNLIVLLQASCVIQENWKSAGGAFTGTSYNFYNTQSKKWQQIWLDNQGGNLQLEGELVNGKMILQSKELKNAKGELQIDKITWTPNPDGSVRQLWESSTDHGKTWNTAFDGLYKKAKPQ